MKLRAGQVIISTALLDGTNFEKAAILLTECNEKGAMGFVFNHPSGRTFNELVEFADAPALPLFAGGPSETDMLYFVHRRPDLIGGGDPVTGNIYAGGDFTRTVALLKEGKLAPQDLKLFTGYCGWDTGELEAEIEEGSWLLVEVAPELVFTTDCETLWEDQLLHANAS
jgi:putative transcriptional regulator